MGHIKKLQWLAVFLISLLCGCTHSSSNPVIKTTGVQDRAIETTPSLLSPSLTPFSLVTKVAQTAESTVTPTKTEPTSTPAFTPTFTETLSLFQKIHKIPQGTYSLLRGQNGGRPDYVIISNSGEIKKRFQLPDFAYGFSSDLRFYVFEPGDPRDNYWMDLSDKQIKHLLIEGCSYPAWSKDNAQLAILCGDGIHFFVFTNGNWVEKGKVERPDELNGCPEDLIFLKYPLWMQNGFAFFVNYSILSKQNVDEFPQHLYILSQECIDGVKECDLRSPGFVVERTSRPITAAAISSDDRFLAVAYYILPYGEIRIYDLQSKKIIKRFDLSMIKQDEKWNGVTSIIWVNQTNEILFSLANSSKVYAIPDAKQNQIEELFDCSANKIYDCSILSTLVIQ